MTLNLILLILMVVAAFWAVLAKSLLKAAVGLAVLSIIITIFMYELGAPLAAVFELSVCAGLITVIFLSTIGLVKPLYKEQLQELSKVRVKRYALLPVLVIFGGIILSAMLLKLPLDLKPVENAVVLDVREVLWNLRQLDLLGQIMILLAGGFGTVLLFKEIAGHDR